MMDVVIGGQLTDRLGPRLLFLLLLLLIQQQRAYLILKWNTFHYALIVSRLVPD